MDKAVDNNAYFKMGAAVAVSGLFGLGRLGSPGRPESFWAASGSRAWRTSMSSGSAGLTSTTLPGSTSAHVRSKERESGRL